jgi:osmoprotectant transport system substrate-binding protein
MKLGRTSRLIAASAAVAMLATACGDGVEDDPAAGGGGEGGGSLATDYDLSGVDYTIGSKDFTEQLVLGNIALQALESAGASVSDQIGLAGTVAAREALLSGEIDLYWEYNGTGWGTHLGNSLDPAELPENLTEEVATRDLEQNSIKWLEAAPFNNTYALAVRSEAQEELGVQTISDFGALIEENPDQATLCIESEFSTRDDGLPGMEEHYGFEVPDGNVSLLDTGVVYTATDEGEQCNFGEVFASDGRIAALDLAVIEDDENFFPPYNPSVTIRQEKFQENEAVADLFAEIAGALDLETMQELNAQVDVEGEFPEDVAETWLRDNGFIE